jgi:hypothetical protein
MAQESAESRKTDSLELFFLSFTSLFFELLIIRWLGCDFKSFMVFKNFPLVTCFVGLGVGVSLGEDRLFKSAPGAMLLSTLLILIMASCGIREQAFPSAGLYQWTQMGQNAFQLWALVLIMMLSLLLVLSGPFSFMLCLGSRIGVLFNKHKPLDAYCIDIGGAICGGVVFALTSFAGADPAMQLTIVALMLLCFVRKALTPIWKPALILGAAVAVAFAGLRQGILPNTEFAWTPYYRLAIIKLMVPPVFPGADKIQSPVFLSVNHSFMQAFMDNDVVVPESAAATNDACKVLKQCTSVRHHYYRLPYFFKQPKDVLVLGAGMGADVFQAIKQGATNVDAVEIDPRVIKIGKEINPTYRLDNVHLHCDDARSFVNSCHKKYDLIVFGCLDSLGLVGMSSMRTDSYVHTKDSYERCLSLLKPDGLFILSFGAGGGDWLRDKIYRTLFAAAGYAPLVMTDEHSSNSWPAYVFVSGEPVREGIIKPPIKFETYDSVMMQNVNPLARIMTDDWPYMYVKPITLDAPYMLVLLSIIGITLIAGRRLIFSKSVGASDTQLFLLGSAFMLIELQSIARLSLIYGNTWFTASIVINGVLLMILAANFIVLKNRDKLSLNVLYMLLFVCLLASYFLPVSQIVGSGQGPLSGASMLITGVTLSPMFLAGLIFAKSYAGVATPARSFAFNLLGSVCGGLLEYISTYVGLNNLVLFALAFYLASMACAMRIPTVVATDSVQSNS